MERKEWEQYVLIKKDIDLWIATDEVNHEYGNSPNEAMENLWESNLRKWEKEDKEMWEETKNDELRI